jgi:hypothetical protein
VLLEPTLSSERLLRIRLRFEASWPGILGYLGSILELKFQRHQRRFASRTEATAAALKKQSNMFREGSYHDCIMIDFHVPELVSVDVLVDVLVQSI